MDYRKERATAECQHRYGHVDIVASGDPSFPHYFSGIEQINWATSPSDKAFEEVAPTAVEGEKCLCCYRKERGPDLNLHPDYKPFLPTGCGSDVEDGVWVFTTVNNETLETFRKRLESLSQEELLDASAQAFYHLYVLVGNRNSFKDVAKGILIPERSPVVEDAQREAARFINKWQ